jgi:hypothetical protein
LSSFPPLTFINRLSLLLPLSPVSSLLGDNSEHQNTLEESLALISQAETTRDELEAKTKEVVALQQVAKEVGASRQAVVEKLENVEREKQKVEEQKKAMEVELTGLEAFILFLSYPLSSLPLSGVADPSCPSIRSELATERSKVQADQATISSLSSDLASHTAELDSLRASAEGAEETRRKYEHLCVEVEDLEAFVLPRSPRPFPSLTFLSSLSRLGAATTALSDISVIKTNLETSIHSLTTQLDGMEKQTEAISAQAMLQDGEVDVLAEELRVLKRYVHSSLCPTRAR